MRNLVIGNKGQIGSAIQKILQCDGYDIINELMPLGQYGVLHICFPYSDTFADDVKKYISQFMPLYTVIHSTVPVGTCEFIGSSTIYSPCRGVHPQLEKGIRTFTKYFAGANCMDVAHIFEDNYVNTVIVGDTPYSVRSLEAMKLWDTTQYGWNIILEKEIYKFCEDNDLDFDIVYSYANKSYNEGYEALGMPQYKKYVLEHRDGKIGGHCVIQNLDLLKTPLGDIIKGYNEDIDK